MKDVLVVMKDTTRTYVWCLWWELWRKRNA